MRTAYCTFETELGPCGIAWNDTDGLVLLAYFQLPASSVTELEDRLSARCTHGKSSPPSAIGRVIELAQRHLAGEPQEFLDITVDLHDLPSFARRVYAFARRVPAGETTTYGELARVAGNPGAARAIGLLLARNPMPLIIPCHRVLAAGGKPGGFSAHGGLSTKSRMLELEGVHLNLPPEDSQLELWPVAQPSAG